MTKASEQIEWIDGHLSMPDNEFSVRLGREDLAFFKNLIQYADKVLTTFEKDEAQGYRARDRQFAIDLLGKALRG
jgi:hypothetical protein